MKTNEIMPLFLALVILSGMAIDATSEERVMKGAFVTGKRKAHLPPVRHLKDFAKELGVDYSSLKRRMSSTENPPSILYTNKRSQYYALSDLVKWHGGVTPIVSRK